MKIIAVVKKRSDFIELQAIIDHFNPQHLCLCIFSNKKIEKFSKITLEDLNKKFLGKVEKLEHFFFETNIKNGKDIHNTLSKFLTKKSVVVLPLLNGSHFIEASGIFKKKNIFICHISDGILDYVPRYKFFFIKRKFNLINLFKYFIFHAKLFFYESDLSFSIWSNYSTFSKKTINIHPNFNYQSETIVRLESLISKSVTNKELILLIPTHIIDKNFLIKHFELENFVDKMIISTYTGEVIFNNEKYWLKGPMTAEELLQTNYFHKVYAGPSTAAFYAKKLNPKTKVSMISNYLQREYWGSRQDIWLAKEAVKIGINFEYLSRK